MSLALNAAIAALILAAPVAGRAAGVFVAASLGELEAAELAAACSAGSKPGPDYEARLTAALQIAFAAGAVWAAIFVQRDLAPVAILFCWVLIVLSAFDVLAFVLPDLLTYALLVCGLVGGALQGPDEALARVAGALAGGGGLLLVKSAYRLAAGREGLGLGDVKLFAAAGAWVGIAGLAPLLLIASLLGLAYAILAPGGLRRKEVPFGAGLCLALWLVWLYGPLRIAG